MESRILLAGGGTAGHTSPLLAVAEALRALATTRFVFVGGRRGLENKLIPAAGLDYRRTVMPSLRDPQSRLSLIAAAFLLPIAIVQAWWPIVRFRPHVCLTAGGLVSLPVLLAAVLWRVPIVLWDGDAMPGRTNRLLARFARRVAVTFPEEVNWFARGKVVVTGNPVRRDLLQWSVPDARARLALAADAPIVLVSGGSQGSEAINGALFDALPKILARGIVVHLTGDARLPRAHARARDLPEALRARYRPYAFLGEEMGAALAACDLVVGRAGSGTIYEALAVGRPLVLVPLEIAASGHQVANARSAVDAGAAVMLRESELDGDRLAAVVAGLLNDPGRLARMRAAAARAGKPDAATVIAREVLAVAHGGARPKEHRPMAERKA